ncbi:hypothetical protein FQZ97_683280 [compost metagenome]
MRGDEGEFLQLAVAALQFEQGALQLLLGRAAFADVLEVHRQALLGGVGVQLEPALEGFVETLEVTGLVVLPGLAVALADLAVVGAGEGVPQRLPQGCRCADVQLPLGLGVDVGEAPIVVEGVEGIADAFQGVRQALGQALRLLQRLLALADVLQGTGDAHDLPVVVAHRLAGHLHVQVPAMGIEHLHVEVEADALLDASLDRQGHPFAIGRQVELQAFGQAGRGADRETEQVVHFFRPEHLAAGQLDRPATELGDAAGHAQQQAVLAHLLGHRPLQADVAGGAVDHLVVGQGRAELQPELLAPGVVHADLQVLDRGSALQLLDGVVHQGAILGVDQLQVGLADQRARRMPQGAGEGRVDLDELALLADHAEHVQRQVEELIAFAQRLIGLA